LRALISKKLDVDKQGSILSNLQGLQSLGGVLGIAMAGRVYDSFGPQSPFIAGSIILIFMIYLIAEGKNNNTIYDLFNKNTAITKLQLIFFKFKYFSSRILDIIVTIFITDSLISIFANRNVFLFPIRKFSFLLLNKFLFTRKLVLNQMTKSLIYSSIK